MTAPQIDRILAHTLADFRLSRGEKQALASVWSEMDGDEQTLADVRHRAFDLARDQIAGPQPLAGLELRGVLDWLEDVTKTLQARPPAAVSPSEALFSPGEACRQRIMALLTGTRTKADVCVFTITDDGVAEAILDAHRRGAALRIIADNDKALDEGSDVGQFQRAGIPVRVDRTEYHMHHKFAIFDDARLLTGSYNWTRGAARYNEENVIVTQERRLVRAFADEFDRLWQRLA